MLTKALSPGVAELNPGMNFRSKSGKGISHLIPQGHHNEAEGHVSLGKGFRAPLQMELPWMSPQIVRNNPTPPMTIRVTIEDAEMENCLGKAKLTSAEGCTGALAQQARGADHMSSFLFLVQWALPLYSDWLNSGAQSAHNGLMLHLEFGVG
jgi:hypothetical protein